LLKTDIVQKKFNCYKTVEKALGVVQSGDQIWVAQGNYSPPANSSYSMVEAVEIYGGFLFGGTFANRQPQTYVTYLNGNGKSVVANMNNGLSHAALLDGFTIRNGTGTSVNGYIRGGGIVNVNSSPWIRNCTIENNSVTGGGGGIGNYSSVAKYTNVLVRNNSATLDGGGIHCGPGNNYSHPIIENSIIENNGVTQRNGGGIMVHGNCATIRNCIIRGNKAWASSNAEYGKGGGLFVTGTTKCDFTNLQITGNCAYNYGGGVYTENNRDFCLTGVTIAGNFAQLNGGGWSHKNSNSNPYNDAALVNSILWGNHATSSVLMNNLDYRVQANNYLDVGYCLIGGFNVGQPNITTLGSMLTATSYSPQFVNYQFANVLTGNTTAGDFHLTEGSDALDFGLNRYYHNNADLDGNQRVVCDNVDLGCYEYQECCKFVFVDKNNLSAIEDGTTWATAYTNLHDALNFARTNSCTEEIRVAGGTYVGEGYRLVSQVKVLGSFISGTSERNLDNPTVLQGVRKNIVPIIKNDFTANSRLQNAVLDGFTMIPGTVSDPYNTTTKMGGGIYNNYASIEINNCEIRDFSVNCGGGIYNENSTVKIYDCVIRNNKARGQTLFGGTGGAGIYNVGSTVNILNSIIYNNTPATRSRIQAYYLIYGGGIYSDNSNLTLTDCDIRQNIAENGGGIYINGTLECNRVNISNNKASTDGGGIYKKGGTMTLENVLISTNLAESGYGGGIQNVAGSGSIYYTTIAGNRAGTKGAALCFDKAATETQSTKIEITNSIIYGNLWGTGGRVNYLREIYIGTLGKIDYMYSVVPFSKSAVWVNDYGTDLGNNILRNPQLVNPVTATVSNYTTVGDFRLQQTSPAINTGMVRTIHSLDLDGNARPVNGGYDMGCYEYMGRSISFANDQGESTDEFQTSIYPNPVNNGQTVTLEIGKELDDYSDFSLVIYDMVGKIVGIHKIDNRTTRLPMNYAKGPYFIHLSSSQHNYVKVKKVIVN
jgi:predicted outer membrane repeat protein